MGDRNERLPRVRSKLLRHPTTKRQTDDDDMFVIPPDILRCAAGATRRGVKIGITPDEMIAMMTVADLALNGDSNDADHDALYNLRERLSELYEDVSRWA